MTCKLYCPGSHLLYLIQRTSAPLFISTCTPSRTLYLEFCNDRYICIVSIYLLSCVPTPRARATWKRPRVNDNYENTGYILAHVRMGFTKEFGTALDEDNLKVTALPVNRLPASGYTVQSWTIDPASIQWRRTYGTRASHKDQMLQERLCMSSFHERLLIRLALNINRVFFHV